MAFNLQGDSLGIIELGTDHIQYIAAIAGFKVPPQGNGRWLAYQSGVIASGPLKGIQFVGPDGTPIPFNFGNVSGLYCTQCDGQDPIAAGQNDPLSVPTASVRPSGLMSTLSAPPERR